MCSVCDKDIKKLRHPKERPLFFLSVILTVVFFFVTLGFSLGGEELVAELKQEQIVEYRLDNPEAEEMTDPQIWQALDQEERELVETLEELDTVYVLIAPIGLILFMFWSFGQGYGHARSNAIHVTERQFPQLYKHWKELADELGMKVTPELYMINGNGQINAYATCVPGYRKYGMVYSDVVTKALNGADPTALRFILGHELGHIRFGHVTLFYAFFRTLSMLPGIAWLIGLPMSRAAEYGCDKVGYKLTGDHDCRGLFMLAAGKHHNLDVNAQEYRCEQVNKGSFWSLIANFGSSHPNVAWRITAIMENRHGPLIFGRIFNKKQ
ncbi:M48 family metallopeptidase [Polycladidibacter hongkongensis]|uniref:M48 family metallopeptidase n=1 Tax=Polycladidibacter hongkongensis TaxID=1647556 RepID=UPI00082F135F|nr:M48 family metallopeptidase [Pseudovibrio hongkongensis]